VTAQIGKLPIDRRTGKISNLLDALADKDDVVLGIGRVFSRQAILHNSRSFAQFLSNPGKKKSHPRPGGNCRLLLGLATSDQSSAG
jgi:hypothetical protein